MPIYYQSGVEVLQNLNMSITPKVVGRFFTYFKFLDLIAKCAKTAYMDTSQIVAGGLIESEVLCLLLERMELSKGFHNLEKKTSKPHTSKITLLPNRQIIQNITLAKASLFATSQDTEPITSARHIPPVYPKQNYDKVKRNSQDFESRQNQAREYMQY